jgi:fatty acid desaturase
MFTAPQVRDVECCLGKPLVDTGYALETPPAERRSPWSVGFMNFLYPLYFDFKIWLKSHTPLARIADKRRMGIAESDAKPEP